MATVHPKVDVVTAGAGWTAAMLAQKLTAAGMTMVSLEQGPMRWTDPDFAHNHDSLRYAQRKEMMVDLGQETWTWRPNPKAPALPYRRFGSFHPGRGLSGSAAHWSGMLWRFLPTDFKYRSHYIEKYGASILPEGNRIQDWPVSYEELEPYYDAFEYDIGASGQAGNLNGQIIEGGNPFEGPRARAFPTPPLTTTLAADLFARAAKTFGYKPFVQPAGILSRGYKDPFGQYRAACNYCGYCTRYGCEVDAKSSAITTHVPVALKTGRYQIVPWAKVVGIETADNGQATGLRYVDASGGEHVQPADIVVLAAYPLSNVKLMLISRSSKHPQGVGNDRGMVGKNYTYQHWHTFARGVFQDKKFNLYSGNTSTINLIYEFNADNFDHTGLGFVGGASIMAGLGETHPIDNAHHFPVAKEKKKFGKDWKDSLRGYWDRNLDIAMQGESLPYEDQFMDLDPTWKDAFGNPLLRLTLDWHDNDYKMYKFVASKGIEILDSLHPDEKHTVPELKPYEIHTYQSTHITGGAIMGSDPSNSVANKYGQAWDTPNLFVTGAALYPQNPGANPTGTLAALAYMTADAIIAKYRKDPGKLMT